MICGRCGKQILCKVCGDTENSQETPWCHDFKPDDCECEKIPRYIGIDWKWKVKSICEVIMIAIFMACLAGFLISFVSMIILLPKVIGTSIHENLYPWLNNLMGWSICVGLVNFLFMISCDKDWRRDYEDHSWAERIREKGAKHEAVKH